MSNTLCNEASPKSRARSIYSNVVQRCTNPANPQYHLYGGRGIAVEWSSFRQFLVDMGVPPAELTLDRIDPDGPYSKANCRWASPKEQARNRRSNRIVEYQGRQQPLAAWAEEFDVPAKTLWVRLERGWPLERALNTPVREMKAAPQQCWYPLGVKVTPDPSDRDLSPDERKHFERRWLAFVEDRVLIRACNRDWDVEERTFEEWKAEVLNFRITRHIQGTASALAAPQLTYREFFRSRRGSDEWTEDDEAHWREHAAFRFAFGRFQPPEDLADLPTVEELEEWSRRRLPPPRRRTDDEIGNELWRRGMHEEYKTYDELWKRIHPWQSQEWPE